MLVDDTKPATEPTIGRRGLGAAMVTEEILGGTTPIVLSKSLGLRKERMPFWPLVWS
jgi:hypothetical protein